MLKLVINFRLDPIYYLIICFNAANQHIQSFRQTFSFGLKLFIYLFISEFFIFVFIFDQSLNQQNILTIFHKFQQLFQKRMDHNEEFQFRQQLQHYIINSNVNKILQAVLQDLIINKPTNPIDYMIKKLQQPQRQFNFVIGPPGFRTFSFLENVRKQMTSQQFQAFNCGQFILEISNQLSSGSQKQIQEGLLINKQQMNEKVLTKIKDLFLNSKKNVIIEGYPKTLEQAVNLQRAQIPPTKVIFMNVNDVHLRQICEYKITSNQSNLSNEDVKNKVSLMVMEYKANLKQLKQFYNSFSEIDLSKNSSEDYILSELRRAFEIKTVSVTPRTCSHVLIIGAPHSGRTTLAKSFAQYYNLVYISSMALISNEVRKDSITGRKIKEAFLKHELVDEFTIQKLIEERINKTDCLMQGFVLEGYPKTQQQYDNLKSLNIRPTLTVVLDMEESDSVSRGQQDKQYERKRFQKWLNFREFLKSSSDKMFWADSGLSQENLFEEVKHEFQKRN